MSRDATAAHPATPVLAYPRMQCAHTPPPVICRFTIAFCLLLRDTDAEYEWDRPHEFQTLLEAAIAVVRLTLGDFGSKSSFHLSNARPLLTYSALLLFIFFVPIVLLNALIAIMVNHPSALCASLRTNDCHHCMTKQLHDTACLGCSQHSG